MKNHRDLAAALTRIEIATAYLTDSNATNTETYETILHVAIASLDADFCSFPDGLLQRYFEAYLLLKRIELGIE